LLPQLNRGPTAIIEVCLTAATSHAHSTLSLHDALPIYMQSQQRKHPRHARHAENRRAQQGPTLRTRRGNAPRSREPATQEQPRPDRKSTRLNSSHVSISYAVFCLKKKKREDRSGAIQRR